MIVNKQFQWNANSSCATTTTTTTTSSKKRKQSSILPNTNKGTTQSSSSTNTSSSSYIICQTESSRTTETKVGAAGAQAGRGRGGKEEVDDHPSPQLRCVDEYMKNGRLFCQCSISFIGSYVDRKIRDSEDNKIYRDQSISTERKHLLFCCALILVLPLP